MGLGALRHLVGALCAVALWCTTAAAPRAAEPAAPRIEARSETLLAVGIVQADRMTIHLSSLRDNAPVRDAAVTVMLRGVLHPTVAQADGGYSLQSPDLGLPGSATVVFHVARGGAVADLQGTLQPAADANAGPANNGARQLWWWVLNFAVCIGFLMLISRRRKAARTD